MRTKFLPYNLFHENYFICLPLEFFILLASSLFTSLSIIHHKIFVFSIITQLICLRTKTNKDSKKINSNGNFLKYFSIGMIGSWIVLTIMLFLQVGNRMSKVIVDDTALLIGTYLVVGIFCGLALYIVFRKATKSDWFRKSR